MSKAQLLKFMGLIGKVKRVFGREDGKPLTANPVILFIAIILIASFFVFLLALAPEAILYPIDKLTAQVFAFLTSVFGLDVRLNDVVLLVTFQGVVKNIAIGYGCDGVLAYLILASAVLPFPCSWRAKLIGLSGGLLFVFIINQVRVAGLVIALFVIEDYNDFSFYHTVVGQIFAIVMVFIFWNFWAARTIRNNPYSKTARANDSEL